MSRDTARERPIRVAVVDDSTFIRKALERMLGGDPRIELVGSARSGEELLANLAAWRPDVISLDLDMPGIGGLETLDRVRAQSQVPVIILSTHSGEGAPLTIEALHRGAVDFIDKQRYSLVDFAALRSVLVEKILQVMGRAPSPVEGGAAAALAKAAFEESSLEIPDLSDWVARQRAHHHAGARRVYDLVVLGASTGGPPAIQTVLEDLGGRVAVPILIAQHMPTGFTHAFAERLNAHLPLEVREAQPGERVLDGTVYIAPAGLHIRLQRDDRGLVLELGGPPEQASHRPSIDVLFRSAVRAVGRRAIGVLLTGMGRDGAAGLAKLRDVGGRTLIQDAATSVVFGMPRAAIELDAADEVLPLGELGRRLRALLAEKE